MDRTPRPDLTRQNLRTGCFARSEVIGVEAAIEFLPDMETLVRVRQTLVLGELLNLAWNGSAAILNTYVNATRNASAPSADAGSRRSLRRFAAGAVLEALHQTASSAFGATGVVGAAEAVEVWARAPCRAIVSAEVHVLNRLVHCRSAHDGDGAHDGDAASTAWRRRGESTRS